MRTHGPLHVGTFVDPLFQENAYLLWAEGGAAEGGAAKSSAAESRVAEGGAAKGGAAKSGAAEGGVADGAGAPREAWIIDPGFAPVSEELAEEVRQRGLIPTALVTHGHLDHIAGLADLRREFPRMPILAPAAEGHMLTDANANLSAPFGTPVVAPSATRLINAGERFQLGSLEFVALDVGGHSPGGLAYYCPAAGVVFSGDALFAGSVGRTDFPGSSDVRLYRNIRDHLLSLPDETTVYSGHGPATTIGEERRTNPFVGGEVDER